MLFPHGCTTNYCILPNTCSSTACCYHSFMAILFLIVCCSHMAAPQITTSFPILVPQQLAATTVLWLFCFWLCVVPTWLHHKLQHPSQYLFLNSLLLPQFYGYSVSNCVLFPHGCTTNYCILPNTCSSTACCYHSFMAILFLVVCCSHMAAPQITASFPILVPQQLASYHSFMAILFLIVCCSHLTAPQITASFPILVPQQLAATTVLWLFCFSLCVLPTWLHHKLLHPSQYIPFLNSSLTVVAII